MECGYYTGARTGNSAILEEEIAQIGVAMCMGFRICIYKVGHQKPVFESRMLKGVVKSCLHL